MTDRMSEFNENLKKAMFMDKKKPNITINKLGEFLTTTPKRQRKILEQFKYPKENKFTFTGYNEAREAIKQYFIKGMDEAILLECLDVLDSKESNNDYQQAMITFFRRSY